MFGIIGMRAGLGEKVIEMSGVSFDYFLVLPFAEILEGNPQEVIRVLLDRRKLEPNGEPSLQNAIEMARSSMRYDLSL